MHALYRRAPTTLTVSDFQTVALTMKDKLFERLTSRRNRVTMRDEQVLKTRDTESMGGIVIGRW